MDTITVKRALVSVSDKSGIVDFCRGLASMGVEIISTGGTAKLLKESGLGTIEISEYTGFPEMLDGRVKTLHPKIYAGLLARRDDAGHLGSLEGMGIGLIDMVVVNLYPFEKTVAKEGVSQQEAIENIDIGGPSMLRASAKNFHSVAVVSSPGQYKMVMKEMKINRAGVTLDTRRFLAEEVFRLTSSYDAAINDYFRSPAGSSSSGMPERISLELVKEQELRYGENPHQRAALYRVGTDKKGLLSLKQHQGKELSFNNILDSHSAYELVNEFSLPAAAIIKHNNPCGAAAASGISLAFARAFACDPMSSFGGIVALNRSVDAGCAKKITSSGFLECVIAPSFSAAAMKIFASKKNLRVLELRGKAEDKYDLKYMGSAALLQEKDGQVLLSAKLGVVTRNKPTVKQMESLKFAWTVAKHVKSNAIVLSEGTRTVGIGAGQMSRVDSMIIAKLKRSIRGKSLCLASDGFFPKPDSVVKAAAAGVKAIIQPGGSIADEKIIKACDKYGISMVFTGIRHFKH